MDRLRNETAAIQAAADSKKEADNRYSKARRPEPWFKPVIDGLRAISGPGSRCMYCSGSEASQVEHYRPKSLFPALALDWNNFLWSCGLCNQYKGNQFDAQKPPVHPVDENVWLHFFIDKFGNLCARWNEALDTLDPRADETISILSLDRQALQESRLHRLNDLRDKTSIAIARLEADQISAAEVEEQLLDWFQQPFQTDVADYFLDGPGADDDEEPFKRLFALLQNSDS